MCEIARVKKIIWNSPGLLQFSFFHNKGGRGGGVSCYCHVV